MKIYTFTDDGDLRPTLRNLNVEDAADVLREVVYYYENDKDRPARIAVNDMLDLDPATFQLYAKDDNSSKPIRANSGDIISWPLRMLMSYRKLNPEQGSMV